MLGSLIPLSRLAVSQGAGSNPTGAKQMNWLCKFLDKFFFLKKGYAALKHVLPFGVASLLLLVLSVPQDNLLPKLVQSLKQPGVWLPAALLSIVSTCVYVISLYVQVRKAYLFKSGNILRTAGTCLLFIFLCASMAYVALRSALPGAFTPAGLWACFLIATLSLTGIGWSTPTTWVDALGVKHPDYEEAQRLVGLFKQELTSVRTRPRGSKSDVTMILSYAGSLRTELEKNVESEPSWARQGILQVRDAVSGFVRAVTATFANADGQIIQDFAQVMNCRKGPQYPDVVNAVNAINGIAEFWHR